MWSRHRRPGEVSTVTITPTPKSLPIIATRNGMLEGEHSVRDIAELQAYVHRTLCDAENLLSDQFQTQARPLIVKGQACGIEFSLHGLRSVRLGAIWAADQNVVYFYNARGERYLKVKLAERLSFDQAKSASA